MCVLQAGQEEDPAGTRDFTFSLELPGTKKSEEDVDERAYGTGEFWAAVAILVDNGDYKFIKTIMSQSLNEGDGIEAVSSGFKALGAKGLEQVFRRFVGEHLNAKRKDALKTKVTVRLRGNASTKLTRTITKIPHLAANGLLLRIPVRHGQRIEVRAKLTKKTNNKDTFIHLDDIEGRSFARRTYDVCGDTEPLLVPVRVSNVSMKTDSKPVRPVVKIEARVIENGVCACTPDRLAFAKEVRAEEKKNKRPSHSYVRVRVGSTDFAVTDISPRTTIVGSYNVAIGDRRHMGRKLHETFEMTRGSASTGGLTPMRFHFKFPQEGTGVATCRPITKEEQKELFRQPTGAVDFCKIIFSAPKSNVRFISKHGTIRLDKWDKDCWISGSFNVTSEDGQTATGVFAFDAGYAGLYDSKTKKQYRGPRFTPSSKAKKRK